MQIKLGQKIRELRHRDGKTQEDLAAALGVTSQAVSRWESNGGYPDMEIMPSIANYFHVTIDELFGYNSDREEKLKKILSKAECALNKQGDMTECVSMLREASKEFPAEPQILLKLGYALNIYGWQKFGARSYTKDGSDYANEDVEYNSKNIYWQEEIQIFEKLLEMDIPQEDREVIISMMVMTYPQMGKCEKAKALAQKQNSIFVSRECLLPKATSDEERDKYQGEAIIALMNELYQNITGMVTTKMSLVTTEIGLNKFLALAHLYEAIFDDGKCGMAHIDLRNLYIHCSLCESRSGNIEKALEYFDIAFDRNKEFKSILNNGVYHYTAPLVSKVSFSSENLTAVPDNFWKGWISIFPDVMQNKIKENTKYAECFK